MPNNVPVEAGSIGKKPTPANSGIGVQTGPPEGKRMPGAGSMDEDTPTAKKTLGSARG